MTNFFKKNYSWLIFLFVLLLVFIFAKLIKTKGEVDFLIDNLDLKKVLPTPAAYPINRNISLLGELTATSVIVIDVDSSVVLYEKQSHQRLFPASTTKIMTALVALEQYSLDQVLTVGDVKTDGNILELFTGEQMTVENLLYGLLVASGNDAALVLAENFPGGIKGFLWAMNQKVQQLNLFDTHFVNPIGLDEKDHYSTTADLAVLTVEAIKNPVFTKIVSTPEFTIKDVFGNNARNFKNTNELVGKIQEIKGVKTGWTENAGECLVSLVEKDDRKVVIAILGSQDRFGETQKLVNWVFENFDWQSTAQPNYR